MDPFIIVLDANRHQELLKQARVDPLIKERPFAPGDRVVQCAHCKIVFLEETWTEVKGRFRHGTATLPEIEIGPVTFHRETSPAADEIHVNGTEEATNISEPFAGQTDDDRPRFDVPHDEPHRSGADNGAQRQPAVAEVQAQGLRLQEIPFQLREIPFALTEVSWY